MIVLGLTGSIGMGKTTTAAMFADAGVPVQDADAVVHTLYAPGGGAVAPIGDAFPDAVVSGGVDRGRLTVTVERDPAALPRLEAIVHPLVAAARERFLAANRAAGARVVLLNVPLLFEVGWDGKVDAVVVVTALEAVQRRRVLSRPGMNEAKLDILLARQLLDAEKRARADFIVDTSRGFDAARAQVREILATVTGPNWRPARRSDALDAAAEPPQVPGHGA